MLYDSRDYSSINKNKVKKNSVICHEVIVGVRANAISPKMIFYLDSFC